MRDSLFDTVRVRLELHLLAATELAVAEEHDAQVQVLAEAKSVEMEAHEAAMASGATSAGLASLALRVPRGLGGPIPLVVLMGDAPADALDTVAALPDDVQIIVLGGDDTTAAKVQALGGSSTNWSDRTAVS